MTAWIAKDPKGRLVWRTVAWRRDDAISNIPVDILGRSWDAWKRHVRKLGWRVVKVELREVKA